MSNRIDFFQSQQTGLALPAANVSILVDGLLCDCLELLEITRDAQPNFSSAKFCVNHSACTNPDSVAAEDIETTIAIGKNITVSWQYNNLFPSAAADSFPVFTGEIDSIETSISDDGEIIEVLTKDFSANLKRITIYGRRVAAENDSTIFLAGVDTIFNEDGRPNAASESAQNNGSDYTVFAAGASQAKFFSCAEIINYLLCEYLSGGQLQTPSIEQLYEITENQQVRDFDVTGLNLLSALQKCCEKAGLKFAFVPRLAKTGCREAIVFYKNSGGRQVELNCQLVGEQLNVSKTNIAKLKSKKNFYPVTHKYIGQGDFKVYEATFDLVKAWDSADEDTNYDKFSPSTNADFYKVKDVYRKWCLNEQGDYNSVPYNQGDAFDFSAIFQSDNFAHCRRRFWPALTADKYGNSLGYFLQVSFDNGENWWQYLNAFNNLLDECGIWFSSDQLDVRSWVAALKGVLKVRITAAVISDERLNASSATGAVNSAAPVIEEVITLPRQ
ncbi:MAG: hypothetical protein KAI59_06375, partial [Planctomycetes bacterium]|nr:hypothetical protein [Planctomycetota bacterium]